MRSVQLSLGVLAILTMTVYVPSTHGVPFFLLGKLEYRLDDTDWELAKKFDDFEQLLKFKDQLSAEEGSEVADALESLSASQPKKRDQLLMISVDAFSQIAVQIKYGFVP
ncbi:hypothetical protein ASZ78_006388 [Callipepla squamata]|uniref:Uncharacterized protein n=1 Tax=Callipepla squamata TaxID=9009 RepID=A0A226N5X8_CALSU|nr:hypothetical protein ASZ78_006388 [Callipepla squamata]